MIYDGRPSPEPVAATCMPVWTGRIHPFHLGHLAVLERSIRTWEIPHIAGLVCHDYELMSREPAGKNSPPYNPFTAWERYRMTAAVPRGRAASKRCRGARIIYSIYGTERLAGLSGSTCLTAACAARLTKTRMTCGPLAYGAAIAAMMAVLDVSDLNLSLDLRSALRKSVLGGEDWRRSSLSPPTCNEYFQTPSWHAWPGCSSPHAQWRRWSRATQGSALTRRARAWA